MQPTPNVIPCKLRCIIHKPFRFSKLFDSFFLVNSAQRSTIAFTGDGYLRGFSRSTWSIRGRSIQRCLIIVIDRLKFHVSSYSGGFFQIMGHNPINSDPNGLYNAVGRCNFWRYLCCFGICCRKTGNGIATKYNPIISIERSIAGHIHGRRHVALGRRIGTFAVTLATETKRNETIFEKFHL